MGSLKAKPKAPPAPTVVYVPQPAPTPVSAAPVQTPTPEQEATEARKQSLLTRDRGRFGTILTSFRGLLTQRDTLPQRKTLLGE